jgi:hypothetical protein
MHELLDQRTCSHFCTKETLCRTWWQTKSVPLRGRDLICDLELEEPKCHDVPVGHVGTATALQMSGVGEDGTLVCASTTFPGVCDTIVGDNNAA